MLRLYRLPLILVILVCSSFLAFGQKPADKLITGDFRGLTFGQFVQQIEAKTNIRFYFEPANVDSLQVTAIVNELPISAVLQLIFKETKLKYTLTPENRIYITIDEPLVTQLPENFFKPGQAAVAGKINKAGEATVAERRSNRPTNTSELKLYEIGVKGSAATGGKATLAGHVRDAKTGEPVIGAAVYIESPLIGATTDQFGYYALTLPVGRHELKIKGLGIKNTKRQLLLHTDGKLEIETEEDITPLKEVLIEAEKDKNVAGMQMGLEKLDIKTMKQVPTAMGEVDILRVVLTLPGVKSVGEGSTGMNVRGGATDQNLILFNDATVFNPSHLFGFFSAFNPDILKTVELYKSAIPAKYGGRLSSVLEISTREGNNKKFAGAGGIGLLTSRLTLEGPIVKDRTSFLVGGRTTYSDWILRKLPNASFKNSSASFYDVNAHLSHTSANEQNSLYATGYISQDEFKLGADTLFNYLNQNASLKWKHIFNNTLYGVLTGTYSQYQYHITSEKNPVNASRLVYRLVQYTLKADFNYFPSPKHTVDFGAASTKYNIAPGSLKPLGEESLVSTDILSPESGVESALYVSDRFDISPRFSILAGLRYSVFNALGPQAVNQYLANTSKTLNTVTDTFYYNTGDIMASYHGPEYRLSAKYALNENSSVKASYNRTRQYIHMLSNTASMSPTDIWKLSDAHIKPQIGDQWALGYYRNFRNNTIETSVETYYKNMHDFVDYKSGADLILNHHVETDVVNAEGIAYGVEVMVKRLTGKLNGWASYTFSRSLARINNPVTGDIINGGNFFPSNFDKPHDFTLIGN